MLKKWIPEWSLLVLVLFSVGTVWLRLAVVRLTYSVNQVDKMIEKATQDRENLQLNLAALRSPRRLEILARTKFGFVQPKIEQVIHLKVVSRKGDNFE